MNNLIVNVGLLLCGIVLLVLWYRRRRSRKMSEWK